MPKFSAKLEGTKCKEGEFQVQLTVQTTLNRLEDIGKLAWLCGRTVEVVITDPNQELFDETPTLGDQGLLPLEDEQSPAPCAWGISWVLDDETKGEMAQTYDTEEDAEEAAAKLREENPQASYAVYPIYPDPPKTCANCGGPSDGAEECKVPEDGSECPLWTEASVTQEQPPTEA